MSKEPSTATLRQTWHLVVPFWLVCFSDTIHGPLKQLFFGVILPNGTGGRTKRLEAAVG